MSNNAGSLAFLDMRLLRRSWMGTCTHWLLGLRLLAYIVMRSIYIKDLLAATTVEWITVTINMLTVLVYLSTAAFYFLATARPDIYYAYNPHLVYKLILMLLCIDRCCVGMLHRYGHL